MNIDDMPAGREMDALVAEKVMGEPIPTEPPKCTGSISGIQHYFEYYPQKAWVPDGTSGGWRWKARAFSTDISAAWEVVEKLAYEPTVQGVYEKLSVVVTVRLYSNEEAWAKIEGRSWTKAETAPLAICRAALKAVGVDE